MLYILLTDLRKAVQELQASHADTINELEKTRSMLLIQHNINQDYQKEVSSLKLTKMSVLTKNYGF